MDDPIISFVTEKAKQKAWDKTYAYLDNLIRKNSEYGGPVITAILKNYGERGVEALKQATPVDTGKTANSWYYEIEQVSHQDYSAGIYTAPFTYRISFKNSNIIDDWCNIAVLVDNGHLSKNGVWIEGYHYINPAIQPIFDEIADSIWKEIIET